MNWKFSTTLTRVLLLATFAIVLMPVSTFAQRRWHRSRVVIYQPQPYVIYQTRPRYNYRTYSYGYPQSYYNTYYSNGYGYTEPYYSTPYYSYRYSQPYYASPTYRYYDNGYYRRHRRNRVRVGIYLR